MAQLGLGYVPQVTDKGQFSYKSVPIEEVEDYYPVSLFTRSEAASLHGLTAMLVFKDQQQGYTDSRAIGYLVLNDNAEVQDILFIEVDPKLRGHGFGKAIIESNVSKMKPSQVLPLDDNARAFFQGLKKDGYGLLNIVC